MHHSEGIDQLYEMRNLRRRIKRISLVHAHRNSHKRHMHAPIAIERSRASVAVRSGHPRIIGLGTMFAAQSASAYLKPQPRGGGENSRLP